MIMKKQPLILNSINLNSVDNLSIVELNSRLEFSFVPIGAGMPGDQPDGPTCAIVLCDGIFCDGILCDGVVCDKVCDCVTSVCDNICGQICGNICDQIW